MARSVTTANTTPAAPDGPRRSGSRKRHWPATSEPHGVAPPRWLNGDFAAVATWAALAPVAFFVPKWINHDPFLPAAMTLPIVTAVCAVIGAVVVGSRWSNDVVAGMAGGLAAAWTMLVLRSALVGTPFGFGGTVGDVGRATASATRYTTTFISSDSLVPTLPSEYPPFSAWLVGRASLLLDEPAWRLAAHAEVLFMSAAVLLSFILWRRLTKNWVALAISCLTLITWSDPRKAFEVITLVVFVPWALEVFGRPPRPRMHWILAGLVGGFIVITYQAWLVYAAVGLLTLLVSTWRGEQQRWPYLRYLALTMAVTFAVSAWYVVPFVWVSITRPGQQVSDLFLAKSINRELFPFLEMTPIGLLQLVGLVGLIYLYRRQWWARPILLVIMGVYAYRLVAMIRFVVTGHTAFLQYTVRLYSVLFTIAGLLVLAYFAPVVADRLHLTRPRMVGLTILGVVLAWTASTFAGDTMPFQGAGVHAPNRAALDAQVEPLPTGGYPEYAPAHGRRPWFPATEVKRTVEDRLGANARPVTLSADDRLFAYYPWPGYIENDRTASATLSRWDDRFAELSRLAATADPAAFAAAAGETKFGPIDVFVLQKRDGSWVWGTQRFSPRQFAPKFWTVRDGLPGNIVVAIRK